MSEPADGERSDDADEWFLHYADDTGRPGGRRGWWLAPRYEFEGAHEGALLFGEGDHASPDAVPSWADCSVCVEQVAASGGYMMACVADEILAAPFAVLGSIGVITEQVAAHGPIAEDAGEDKRRPQP